MSDELSGAVEALKNKAINHAEALKALPEMAELVKIHSALNTLEDICGIEKTGLSDLFGFGIARTTEKRSSLVKVGEFFGKSPLEAAKLYLKKRGTPATLDEIIENLSRGSCEVKNKGDLSISLARSTFEIAKLGENIFGLLDWFPDVKRSRSPGRRERPSSSGTAQIDSGGDSDTPTTESGTSGGAGEDSSES